MSQQINLYNPLFRRKEKYFSAQTMLIGLGLLVLGLAAFYLFAQVQTRDAERAVKDQAGLLALQREQLVKLASSGRSTALESEVARLEGEARNRRLAIAALHTGELGNTAGFSEYFAAFGRKAMPGVWLTGFSVGDGGNVLQVRGRVLHPDLVPVYLKTLNDESVMRGRQVTELKLAAKAAEEPKPGTPAAAHGATPARFVEFSLIAQLHTVEAANPAAVPAAKGGG